MTSLHVCAVSDLHGRLPDIPPCDILLVAGDICPDFDYLYRDRDLMRLGQTKWLDDKYRAWEGSVPAAHILATPGNHDWITRMPDGMKTRLFVDEGCTIEGRTFWFSPWTGIEAGPWNYILTQVYRGQRFAHIPRNLDVLVTHSPSKGVLDMAYGDVSCGCPELREAILRTHPRHNCFGHIHEGQRYGGPVTHLGDTMMYNCAMWGPNWKPVEFDI